MPSQAPRPRSGEPGPLTPAQRSLRSRLAALELHSRTDGTAHTAPARSAFIKRFETQVDPDHRLPAPERERRAQLALRGHMTRLAFKSAQSRQGRPTGGES